MVTLKDVARKAGVSIGTASSVINDSRPVSEKKRAKVLAAVDELGYRPNHTARSLRKGRTRKVIYLIPSITNLVFAKCVEAVQAALKEKEFDLLLCNNDARKDILKSYLDLLSPSSIDGVIMTQTMTCGRIVADICRERGVPLVVLSTPHHLEGVDTVTTDDDQGMALVVDRLWQAGHRRIAFAMVKGSRLHEARLAGFRKGLADRGVAHDPDLIIEASGHDHISTQVRVKERLQRSRTEFTGLVCCNDYMAFGAIRALAEADLAVPSDVSVVGFDDSIAIFVSPSLTTVSWPTTQLAKAAVDLLVDRIENPKAAVRRLLFPQELIIRSSTDSAPPAFAPVAKGRELRR